MGSSQQSIQICLIGGLPSYLRCQKKWLMKLSLLLGSAVCSTWGSRRRKCKWQSHSGHVKRLLSWRWSIPRPWQKQNFLVLRIIRISLLGNGEVTVFMLPSSLVLSYLGALTFLRWHGTLKANVICLFVCNSISSWVYQGGISSKVRYWIEWNCTVGNSWVMWYPPKFELKRQPIGKHQAPDQCNANMLTTAEVNTSAENS